MKRLLVCCDGTWLDSQSGLMQGKIPPPSNITRLSRAIKSVSRDGVPQVVFYQAGLGSTGGFINRILGGIGAEGLSENIRSAYSFLATNYSSGDEIYFFGFSRGAFTVRSIAGMIDGVGLLTKDGLPYLADIYADWLNSRNPNYRPKNPDIPFPNKPSAVDPKYKKLLAQNHMSRLNVPIQVVGVFDTVGSLGIPRIPWLEALHLQPKASKLYRFFDTKLNNHIINAFQALALDEHRAAFSPSVWEKPQGCETNLRQVWFAGAHSNVGGGYDDQELANITLAWMMAQVQNMIDFDEDYLIDQYDSNEQYYADTDQKPRPWSFGKLYQSFTGYYILGGRTTRKPGDYNEVDPDTAEETSTPLRDTMEYVHPSVRTRKLRHGPGVGDRGDYEAHPLDRYKLRPPNSDRRIALWEPRSRRDELHPLPESPLWGYEKELLAEDPRMNDYIMSGGSSRGRSRNSSSYRKGPSRKGSWSPSPVRNGRAITAG